MIKIEIDRSLQIFVVVTFDVIFHEARDWVSCYLFASTILLCRECWLCEPIDVVRRISRIALPQFYSYCHKNHFENVIYRNRVVSWSKKSYMLLNFKPYLIFVSISICISYLLDQSIKIVCLNLRKIFYKPFVDC